MTLQPLTAGAAYRLWAPTYDAENPISVLEDRVVGTLTPSLAGRRLLDVACGTGRRMPPSQAQDLPRTIVGLDLVFDMVMRARSRRVALLGVADMRALPCAAQQFDIIWCRLAAGHVPDLAPVYRELARVAARGATIVVSDFHPAAARSGHRRTFRDEHGALHEVQHFVHEASTHTSIAAAAGLHAMERVDATVDRSVRAFYDAAGRIDAYEQQAGLPLVLALAFRA